MSQMDSTSRKWARRISSRSVTSSAWKSSQVQQLSPRSSRQSLTLQSSSLIWAELLSNRRSFHILTSSWSSISDLSKFWSATWFCSKSKDIFRYCANRIRRSSRWASMILLAIALQTLQENVALPQSLAMKRWRQFYLMSGLMSAETIISITMLCFGMPSCSTTSWEMPTTTWIEWESSKGKEREREGVMNDENKWIISLFFDWISSPPPFYLTWWLELYFHFLTKLTKRLCVINFSLFLSYSHKPHQPTFLNLPDYLLPDGSFNP